MFPSILQASVECKDMKKSACIVCRRKYRVINPGDQIICPLRVLTLSP